MGAATAVAISDIPFNGPVCSVSVGLIDGVPVINPTKEQRDVSTLELTLSGTLEKVVMIEAGAKEVPENQMLEAIACGHEAVKELCRFIQSIADEVGKKEKIQYTPCVVDEDVYQAVEQLAIDNVKFALDTDDKLIRDERMAVVTAEVHEKLDEQFPEKRNNAGGSFVQTAEECSKTLDFR